MLLALACAGRAKPAETPAGPVLLDEPALMASLRSAANAEPEKALSLCEEGERRFGESVFAEERRALAIRALIDLQRIGAARSRAYGFLERYPDGPFSANIAAMTGVHAPPKKPVR
ncbi:MAG: hypothetical protein JXP73_10170 [Deltaproteobacteria bacterium]|nr:hypothetical protein [Deltaproteobacteria bacterium]